MILKTTDWDFEGAQQRAKRLSIHSRQAYIFKEADRRFNLVIETELKNFQPISTLGLKVFIDTFLLEGDNEINVLVFHCSEPAFFDAYIDILNKVISDSEDDNFESRAREVINVWIRFYQKPRKPRLSDQLILGLMGELCAITELLAIGVDKTSILEAWTGPDQESKDFSFQETFIEVKASNKLSGHVHKINGVDQLDSSDKSLYLFSYHFLPTNDNDESFTLNDLIKKLNIDVFYPEGLEIEFYDKLYAYGYDRREEQGYEDLILRLGNFRCFKVDEEFPKIVRKSFTDHLSHSISNIVYLIDLNALEYIDVEDLRDEIY